MEFISKELRERMELIYLGVHHTETPGADGLHHQGSQEEDGVHHQGTKGAEEFITNECRQQQVGFITTECTQQQVGFITKEFRQQQLEYITKGSSQLFDNEFRQFG